MYQVHLLFSISKEYIHPALKPFLADSYSL